MYTKEPSENPKDSQEWAILDPEGDVIAYVSDWWAGVLLSHLNRG